MKKGKGTLKHQQHVKHLRHEHHQKHMAWVAKHPAAVAATAKKAAITKAHKKRGWSPDSGVALCSARAVAQSLQIALGRAVSDAAVLDLYWSVATDADAGASILATLDAVGAAWAAAPVLAFQPLDLECAGIDGPVPVVGGAEQDPVVAAAACEHPFDRQPCFAGVMPRALLGQCLAGHRGSLILGVDWPEPHAVVAHQGTWWSWGEPHSPADFPGAVIEEAWAVTWA